MYDVINFPSIKLQKRRMILVILKKKRNQFNCIDLIVVTIKTSFTV